MLEFLTGGNKIGNKSAKAQKLACISAGCFFGLLFVLLVFSPGNIDPLNTEWVINGGGDNLQHYLGWRFFRNSPWTRYVLFMRNWNYPVGSSVIVTDSNPLFCIIFKLFDNILPSVFQFNGIWILTSYILLAIFAGLIGWKLTHHFLLTLSGILFAVLNPVILQRSLIHDTLTAHWLILASIWLFLNEDKKWNLPGWFILTELTLLIHVYFIPMLAFVLSLQLIRMITKKTGLLRLLSVCFAFAAAVISGYFIFGYVYVMPLSGSYGELSMNLNAFFNPDGNSSILSSRPTLPLQYEGFNYWGLGLLVLVPAAVLFGFRNVKKQWLFYLIPTGVLILFSVSNRAYFDLSPVFSIELSEQLLSLFSVFRSSGRMAWPVYYLVLFCSLYLLDAPSRRKKAFCFVALVCVLLQVWDLKDFCIESARRFRSPANQIADLPEKISGLADKDIAHLFVSDGDARTIDALALFAAENRMTFNKNTNARGIKPVFGGDILLMDQLTCGQIEPESAYLFLTENFPVDLKDCETAIIEPVNDWILVRHR